VENSFSYERYMKRPLADFIALTPGHRSKLEQVGVSEFGEFVQLEIDSDVLATVEMFI